jgi:integrase
MQYALHKLEQQYGQRDAQTIKGAEIRAWLAASAWAIQTRNGLLTSFNNAFNIAKNDLNLISTNPLLNIKRFASSKVSKKSFPKFLSVPQLTALLNAADPQLIPYIAICAFAGLRSAECKSLTWTAVDLERNKIVVPENISKTGQERTIPIAANLAAWLATSQIREDYIYPRLGHSETLNQLLRTAKEKAGVWPWKPNYQNALRKSFCSYHYEMHGSADRTSQYAGHDIRMLIKVYRHAVEHEEAENIGIFTQPKSLNLRQALIALPHA